MTSQYQSREERVSRECRRNMVLAHSSESSVIKVYPRLLDTVVAESRIMTSIVSDHGCQVIICVTQFLTSNIVKCLNNNNRGARTIIMRPTLRGCRTNLIDSTTFIIWDSGGMSLSHINPKHTTIRSSSNTQHEDTTY